MNSKEKQKQIDEMHDLGRYRKKISDLLQENKNLRAAIEAADRGVKQINDAMDSILIEVAKKYGTAAEDGTLTVEIPLVSVLRNMRDYEVHAEPSKENDCYVVTARRRWTHNG